MAAVGVPRRWGRRTFVAAFSLYAAVIILWLLLGALPSLARELGPFADLLGRWAEGGDALARFSGRVLVGASNADAGPRVALDYLLSALNLGLGIWLVRLRGDDRVARLLAVGLVGTAATFNHQGHSVFKADLLGATWLSDGHDLVHVLSGVAYMYAVVLFPDGRVWPRTSTAAGQTAVRAAYALAALAIGVLTLVSVSEAHPGQAFFVRFFGFVIPIVGVVAQAERMRSARTVEGRQQSRLLRLALLPIFVGGVVFSTVAHSQLDHLGLIVLPVLFAIVPVGLAVGIVRYRLWDVDVVVNRALVYGALAGFVGAVYVAVVVGLGELPGVNESSTALAVAATVIAAVAFEPVRERVIAWANRLVYGQRAAPNDLLASLAERLAESAAPDEMLVQLASALGEGTGAPGAAVWRRSGRTLRPAATWPVGAAPPAEVAVSAEGLVRFPDGWRGAPVLYQGEVLGALGVVARAGVGHDRAENSLLDDLAARVGLVLHNVGLVDELSARVNQEARQARELRASRQRIVRAQDAERRRLERDIHDGAQQYLVALAIQLSVSRSALGDDPDAAPAMLVDARELAMEAAATVRNLSRGIYPAALEADGIGAALRVHARGTGMVVHIDCDGVTRHAGDVESATYFTCLEALQNATKHAKASSVSIRLRQDIDALTFEVIDDGVGFEASAGSAGTGLRSLADRLATVGGSLDVRSAPGDGTTVAGRVPIGRARR